jgi:hypothetical protein
MEISVSVDQWIREFKYWSTLKDTQIGKFTSDCKERVLYTFQLENKAHHAHDP